MNIVQIGLRLREQMEAFLGNLPLCNPARRFALEALYGIASRGSLKTGDTNAQVGDSLTYLVGRWIFYCLRLAIYPCRDRHL